MLTCLDEGHWKPCIGRLGSILATAGRAHFCRKQEIRKAHIGVGIFREASSIIVIKFEGDRAPLQRFVLEVPR